MSDGPRVEESDWSVRGMVHSVILWSNRSQDTQETQDAKVPGNSRFMSNQHECAKGSWMKLQTWRKYYVKMSVSYRSNEMRGNAGHGKVFDMKMQISSSGTAVEESEAKKGDRLVFHPCGELWEPPAKAV